MEPITTTAAILSVISNVASFFGARKQASATEREGRRLAKDAIERGEFDYARYAEQAAGFLGTQRTNSAAQMVDVMQGTAATIRSQTEQTVKDDLAMIRENATREAFALRRGAKNQANQLRAQSYGALGSAFGTLGAFGASAMDVYQRGRNARIGKTIGRDVAAWS